MFDVTPCPHCGLVKESTHWNEPGALAIVDSEIMIRLPAGTVVKYEWQPDGELLMDEAVKAIRTEWLRDKNGDMTYKLVECGGIVVGKFYWTHP